MLYHVISTVLLIYEKLSGFAIGNFPRTRWKRRSDVMNSPKLRYLVQKLSLWDATNCHIQLLKFMSIFAIFQDQTIDAWWFGSFPFDIFRPNHMRLKIFATRSLLWEKRINFVSISAFHHPKFRPPRQVRCQNRSSIAQWWHSMTIETSLGDPWCNVLAVEWCRIRQKLGTSWDILKHPSDDVLLSFFLLFFSWTVCTCALSQCTFQQLVCLIGGLKSWGLSRKVSHRHDPFLLSQ